MDAISRVLVVNQFTIKIHLNPQNVAKTAGWRLTIMTEDVNKQLVNTRALTLNILPPPLTLINPLNRLISRQLRVGLIDCCHLYMLPDRPTTKPRIIAWHSCLDLLVTTLYVSG